MNIYTVKQFIRLMTEKPYIPNHDSRLLNHPVPSVQRQQYPSIITPEMKKEWYQSLQKSNQRMKEREKIRSLYMTETDTDTENQFLPTFQKNIIFSSPFCMLNMKYIATSEVGGSDSKNDKPCVKKRFLKPHFFNVLFSPFILPYPFTNIHFDHVKINKL